MCGRGVVIVKVVNVEEPWCPGRGRARPAPCGSIRHQCEGDAKGTRRGLGPKGDRRRERCRTGASRCRRRAVEMPQEIEPRFRDAMAWRGPRTRRTLQRSTRLRSLRPTCDQRGGASIASCDSRCEPKGAVPIWTRTRLRSMGRRCGRCHPSFASTGNLHDARRLDTPSTSPRTRRLRRAVAWQACPRDLQRVERSERSQRPISQIVAQDVVEVRRRLGRPEEAVLARWPGP